MRQGRPRLRLRGVIITAVATIVTIAGYAVGSAPMCGVGVALLLVIGADLAHVIWVDALQPLPSLIRVATPNPSVAGQTTVVSLVQAPNSWQRLEQGSGLDETVPDDLVGSMTVVPAQTQGAAVFSIAYRVSFPRRGKWTVGPYTTTRWSPIGLWGLTMADTATKDITAWPRTVAMNVPMISVDREGRSGFAVTVQPKEDNVTLREYSPGDDLRRVHWRSSAKRGELMSRSEEPTDSDRVWIGLMIPSGTVATRREEAVSLAASLCMAGDEAHMPVELAFGSRVHRASFAGLMNELAVASTSELGAGLSTSSPQGIAILITARSTTHGLSASSLVRAPRGMGGLHRRRCWAVVLSNSDTDVATVESLGWRVIHIPSDLNLSEAAQRITEETQLVPS